MGIVSEGFSYFDYLYCSECGDQYNPAEIHTFCKKCNAPLLAHYDLEKMRADVRRDQIAGRPKGMWRWHELLPVQEAANQVTLGEGDTPLLKIDRAGSPLGLKSLYLKDESLNPTATFKARGLAAAISRAKELGITKVIIPTAGNAGGAMAAYAARAGQRAFVFMPEDTPLANIKECQLMGAEVHMVEGVISDAAKAASQVAQTEDWFDVSTFKEPYRVEGKKVMGLEVAQEFDWVLPGVIIYPTGGGTGLVGMWKAFQELEALGWLDGPAKPRMVVVQSEGCAPVVKAFLEGKDSCDFWDGAQTIASGLRVPKSFADRLILHTLYESHGIAVAVRDEEILTAQKALAADEGIFAAPEGAATLAAVQRLMDQNWLDPAESIVLFNTGSGLKYL
jgi:threonine synthase